MYVSKSQVKAIADKGKDAVKGICLAAATIATSVALAHTLAGVIKHMESSQDTQQSALEQQIELAKLAALTVRAENMSNYFRTGDTTYNRDEDKLDELLDFTATAHPLETPPWVGQNNFDDLPGLNFKFRSLGPVWDYLKLKYAEPETRALGPAVEDTVDTVSSPGFSI